MKLFFKLFFGLLFLLLLGVAVFIMTFDLNSYRGLIVEKASEALHRDVMIDSLELKASLVPTVVVKGITVASPAVFENAAPLAKIDSAEVTLALLPLFKKQIQINEFRVGVADFNLIDNGTANNWTLNADTPKSESVEPSETTAESSEATTLPAVVSRLNIDSILLKRLVVTYEKNGQKQQVELSDFVLRQLKAISFVVSYDGNAVKVAGTMNDLLDLLRQKPDYVFNLTVDALGGTAKISGKIGDTVAWRNFSFDFEIKTSSLSRSLALLKIQNKMIPSQAVTVSGFAKGNLELFRVEPLKVSIHNDGFLLNVIGNIENVTTTPKVHLNGDVHLTDSVLAGMYGLKPMRADFSVSVADKKVRVSTLKLTANKSDVNMNAVASFAADKPVVTAQIASTYFNPQDLMAEKSATSSSGVSTSADTKAAGALFSDNPIDLSVLKSIDADVTLQIENLEIAPQVFKGYWGVNTKAVLKEGVLTLNPMRLTGIDGIVQGVATVNAAGTTPQIKLNLKGKNLSVDKIKSVTQILQGSVVNTDIDVTAVGQSPKALVGGLNGSVILEVSEGKIVNKWFNTLPMAVGLIQSRKSVSYSTTDQDSKLNCAALNLNIQNGVVQMDKSVALETSLLNFSVSGTVNLPKETLSLSMVPSVTQLEAGTNRKLALAKIVKVSGPFNKLQVGLDARDMVQNAAKQGLDILAGKLAEKVGQNDQTSTQTTAVSTGEVVGNLCEIALGRKPKGKVEETVVSTPVQTTPKAQAKAAVEKVQETFKSELLKSVAEAIKK